MVKRGESDSDAHIGLCRNFGRAVEFYGKRLAHRHLFTVQKLGFLDCGGSAGLLAVRESLEFDHPRSVLYGSVDDIQRVFGSLSERGVRFEGPPHLTAKMFRDSENNLLSLMSNVAILKEL